MQRGQISWLRKQISSPVISSLRYCLSTKKSTCSLDLDSKLSQMKVKEEKTSPSVLQPPSLLGCSAGSPRSSHLCSDRSGLCTAAHSCCTLLTFWGSCRDPVGSFPTGERGCPGHRAEPGVSSNKLRVVGSCGSTASAPVLREISPLNIRHLGLLKEPAMPQVMQLLHYSMKRQKDQVSDSPKTPKKGKTTLPVSVLQLFCLWLLLVPQYCVYVWTSEAVRTHECSVVTWQGTGSYETFQ